MSLDEAVEELPKKLPLSEWILEMLIQKRDFLDKVKERENWNRRNTKQYFEDLCA